jgi:CubicO group peptidase (beta-lactamase class C family)
MTKVDACVETRRSPLHPLRAAMIALAMASVCQAAPPPDLDEYVSAAMRAFEVPGAAVSIAEGETRYARGYGVRKLGEATAVDEHTLFSIGSTTKAFTSAAVAILVDEGKLAWDDRVTERLPEFAMYDPWVTREIRVRDLLSHRSGMREGSDDILYHPSTALSRAEIVSRVRYIEPVTSFRSAYAYNNVLYVVAGNVVEQASRTSWDRFIQERIFSPLGMHDSAPTLANMRSNNAAWPHARFTGAVRNFGPVKPLAERVDDDNVAAAGAIYSSAADMARWVQVQFNAGKISTTDRRLFSAAAGREMWTPHIAIPPEELPGPLALAAPTRASYALGWRNEEYRGHSIIRHSAGSVGGKAIVAIIPQKQLGLAVMINSEDGDARMAIYYRLLDHYLDLPPVDWIGALSEAGRRQSEKLRKIAADQFGAARKAAASISELTPYVGRYRDPIYGMATIERSGSALQIRFEHTPGMTSALASMGHDTFRTNFADKRFLDAFATFVHAPDGSVEQMTLRAFDGSRGFYDQLIFKPVRPVSNK